MDLQPFLDGLEHRPGLIHGAVTEMLEELNAEGRLTRVTAPLVAAMFKVAETLEASHRGYAVAELNKELRSTWQQLVELPVPDDQLGDEEERYDVVMLHPAVPGEG